MKKIFEGAISCKAILENKERKCFCLYMDKNKKTKDFSYIERLAKQRKCPIEKVEREKIDTLCTSKGHGGICLEASLKEKKSLNCLRPQGYIAYIDGVEDPYNLGSVIRTLYASGCNALILPDRDWSFAESTILKASAGTYEKLSIYWSKSDEEFISLLNKNKIPLILAHRKFSISLDSYTFPNNFCLAIGGALRGISSKLQKAAQQNVHIEYGRDFRNALDTPSAVAVFSFFIAHQRKDKGYEN